jgi:hypothetical protein
MKAGESTRIFTVEGKYKPTTTTEFISVFCLLHVSALVKSHHQAIKTI